MFEDLSRNHRFLGWLEMVARGERTSYPEPDHFAEDAMAFLKRFDRMRSDQRTLDKAYRDLLAGLGELAEASSQARPDQMLDALNARLESAEATRSRQTVEHESELQEIRKTLEAERAELESARAKFAETRLKLEREQRKLDPVLRYAYKLRRLVQKIHVSGELTPSIRRYIEEMLEAGGASVSASAPHAAKSNAAKTRSTNSTSTLT